MKHRVFKIRKVQTEEPNQKGHSSLAYIEQRPAAEIQLAELKNMFASFMKHSTYRKTPADCSNVEPRDRQIKIQLPAAPGNLEECELKRWITQVVTNVTSSAFNYFSKGEMSFQQAKVYCSENIFKNLVNLNRSHPLSKASFEIIDNHVKIGVINYLNAKYPLTQATQINKKLQQVVRQVDNIQAYSNNYINTLGVEFTYRQDGNYNELIMNFLNQVMNLPDNQSHDQKSNYAQFEEFMSSLFQKVQDLSWMRGDKNEGTVLSENDERKLLDQKEKYKSKVKQYTHYLIGRKLSQNTPNFSQKQIQNGNLKIKSSAILRIMTKWCAQLEEKYYNCHYSNRSESVKVQKGSNINNLLSWMREELDLKLTKQRGQISTFLSELSQNNYEMQSQILQAEQKLKGNQEIKLNQKVCGKFAYKIVRNLHTYVIAYLNKLIHSLLKVSKNFYEENRLHTSDVWPSPPNLISFKVADLMRCKFSSRQKEILRIYEQINRISRQSPDKLKIIRIKNRLKKGTNDILMNIKFNNSVLCEIQLAIKSGTSDFIKCSNMFHHYLYELQRSFFGPLTELCSIWNSLDQRTQIYAQLVEGQERSSAELVHTCPRLLRKFQMVPYDKPFICSQCSLTYYHNNYFKNHIRCSLCAYFVCANCRIQQESQQELKSKLIQKEEIRSLCGRRFGKNDEFPQFGICILKVSKHPQIEIFTKITYQENDYLLGRREGKLYQIADFRTKQEKNQFRLQHLLFEFADQGKKITLNEAIKHYILPLMMRRNFKKQKESISLMNLGLVTEECRDLLALGSKNQKQNVKHLFISDNKIEELPFVPEEFPNLTWISATRNRMRSYKGIEKLTHLKQLFSIKNNLQEFPSQVCYCPELEVLTLSDNQFTSISDNIGKLKKLREFECNDNPITAIPANLFECTELVMLKFYNNFLREVPTDIYKLKNLEVLQLISVNIRSIPAEIGQLIKLRQLRINYNSDIAQIPLSLANCVNLEVVNINFTKITSFCHFFQHWTKLKNFESVSYLPKIITPAIKYLKKLQNLNLSNSPLVLPAEFGQLSALRTLLLNQCKLSQLPFSFKSIKQLQILQLQRNDFRELSIGTFTECISLQAILLNSCSLTTLPSFSGCRALKTLSFPENRVSSIPAEHLQNLTNLETILANNNELTVLPKAVLKLKKLNKLNLTRNKLVNLVQDEENSLVQLENLTIVYLSQNELTSIPKVLFKCSRIKELYVSNNKITEIDPEIKQLIDLEELDLDNNLIRVLPEELTYLQNLKKLYFSSNKIEVIPKFIEKLSKLDRLIGSCMPIRTIQCIDWILKSEAIVKGTLYQTATKMKDQQRANSNLHASGGGNATPTTENTL